MRRNTWHGPANARARTGPRHVCHCRKRALPCLEESVTRQLAQPVHSPRGDLRPVRSMAPFSRARSLDAIPAEWTRSWPPASAAATSDTRYAQSSVTQPCSNIPGRPCASSPVSSAAYHWTLQQQGSWNAQHPPHLVLRTLRASEITWVASVCSLVHRHTVPARAGGCSFPSPTTTSQTPTRPGTRVRP